MSYAAVKITRFRKRVYEEQHEQIVLEHYYQSGPSTTEGRVPQNNPPLPVPPVPQPISGLLKSED